MLYISTINLCLNHKLSQQSIHTFVILHNKLESLDASIYYHPPWGSAEAQADVTHLGK